MLKILLSLLICATMLAQVHPGVMSEAGMTNLPEQRIGANDLLAVSVYDAPELTRTVRVSAEGMIRLPMLKESIPIQGLLPREVEEQIALALEAEQILVSPVVTVTIVEYHSRPISVAGAVRRPLTFQANTTVTLLDAITKAEGLSTAAGPEILVSSTQTGRDGETVSLVQRVPVKELIDNADAEFNIKLHGGEEIRVPEAGMVYVVGNVNRPGSFPVQDASGTSVFKMLALSEGLARYASKQAYIYRQEAGTGSKNEIEIPLRKIMERRAPDVPLQANDILYVPDNRTKRTRLSALEKIISFGSTTASGLLIWGVAR